jgi:transposase-like protein
LSRAEWIIRDGGTIRQACIEIGVSETTLLRWRRQYGGLSVDQLQRLKTTEDANASLQQQLGTLEAEVERLELENASLRQEFRRIKRVA